MTTPAASPSFRDRLIKDCPANTAVISGGVTAPQGFSAAGIVAGIKKAGKDLALLVSDRPCQASGVFTRNLVCAAPVTLSKTIIRAAIKPVIRAIVVNAGNANACTGYEGVQAAQAMVDAVNRSLGFPDGSCLVASTGVIGHQLPKDKAITGIQAAVKVLSVDGGADAARAIMTTDTVPKEIAVEVTLSMGTVVIGGMCKGSGMIHPDMATMLGFITTDAAIAMTNQELHSLLRNVADSSFNSITVDNDTSTNDSLFLLANGASGISIMPGTPDWSIFVQALTFVAQFMAITMAGDGEGASKLFEVVVSGAADDLSARKVAMTIAHSYLAKTAIFGEDANWGRVICAAGYSGVAFDPNTVDIFLGDLAMCKDGMGLPFDEAAAKVILEEEWVTVKVKLGDGLGRATVWTCDMTFDYVKINASYRS